MTTASSQPSRSPTACVWCGAGLGDGEQLGGRIRCRTCGVASTDPWPTAAELDAAYRPDAGRFAGPGDRLLRAGPHGRAPVAYSNRVANWTGGRLV